MEDRTSWPTDLSKIFVLIPETEKALMIRDSSDATAKDLKDLLLTKYSEDLHFVRPTLSHKGNVLSEETLSRWTIFPNI